MYRWKCDHDKSNGDKVNRCNICRRAVYKKTHPRRVAQTNQDRNLRKTFRITLEQYLEQLASQNGVCAICKKPETATRLKKVKALAVDHSHSTNKNRGLLCQRCNVGLGHFLDSPELLITAAQYLKSYE